MKIRAFQISLTLLVFCEISFTSGRVSPNSPIILQRFIANDLKNDKPTIYIEILNWPINHNLILPNISPQKQTTALFY